MSLLTQYDADARSVRRATRRFLFIAFLVTLALIVAIFVRQGLLRQTVSFSFVADSAQDIAKGQAVRIAGFRVGSVTEVNLRDDGSVAVNLEVDAENARFVTHDARIELRKEGRSARRPWRSFRGRTRPGWRRRRHGSPFRAPTASAPWPTRCAMSSCPS